MIYIFHFVFLTLIDKKIKKKGMLGCGTSVQSLL